MVSPIFKSVRFESHTTASLNVQSFNRGDVLFDNENTTLVVFDGHLKGGYPLLRADFSNIDTSAVNANLTFNLGTGTVTAAGFTGNLTGNVTGNLTGNVTGKLIGDIYLADGTTLVLDNGTNRATPAFYGDILAPTGASVLNNGTDGTDATFNGNVVGNASTATTFKTARKINNVNFDGSADVLVPSINTINSSVTLAADGTITLPNGGQIDLNGGYIRLKNTTQTGAQIGSPDDQNYVQTDNNGVVIQVNSDSLGNLTQQNWAFSLNGDLAAPGNISTTTGTVTGKNVSVTNDVTVGGNANISTVPTLPIHAANKKYVDARAIAIAVAMG